MAEQNRNREEQSHLRQGPIQPSGGASSRVRCRQRHGWPASDGSGGQSHAGAAGMTVAAPTEGSCSARPHLPIAICRTIPRYHRR